MAIKVQQLVAGGSWFAGPVGPFSDSKTATARAAYDVAHGVDTSYTIASTPANAPVLATGASHTVDDVIGELQTLGFVKQS